MSGTTPWQAQSNVEPIAAVTIEAIANIAAFNTVSGCAATYSGANMDVTLAAGVITHTSAIVASAGGSVTLVSDPTNPRWTYIYESSLGVPSLISGSAAATPAVPDPGANPTNQLVYVQAALTVATNATYKLDKRVMATSPVILAGSSTAATSTTSTSAVDLVSVVTSMPVALPFRVEVNYRKQALAAQTIGIGLKLNSTTVITAGTSADTSLALSSGTQRAEDGLAVAKIGPRSSANYLNGAMWSYMTRVSASGAVAQSGPSAVAADLAAVLPNATITAVVIRAINNTTSNAAEVTSIRVLAGLD